MVGPIRYFAPLVRIGPEATTDPAPAAAPAAVATTVADALAQTEPTTRYALKQRAAEFLTGAASVVFSFMASLWWTNARGLPLGKTAVNAVSWLANISWITTVVELVSLSWSIYDAYIGKFASHGVETVLFNGGFALATVLTAGVLKSVSLVAVYQLGEGNPTLNCATVTTWFAFAWMFAWRSLRAWNDSFLLRMTRVESFVPNVPGVVGIFNALASKAGGGGTGNQVITRRWRM